MAPVHDYSLDNASGANFRSDLNNALAAIVSNNSNSSEPSTKYAYQWWADTTNSVLKIRNSNNDAWITLFTLAGGVDVDAASNFNEDVTFTGASANIVFDKSDNALEFNDNAKATFGTDVDLSISHDGTTFQIFGTGAGKATVQIEGEGGADPTINFLANNTQHFSIGIDDSDADKFKISKHSALGTNDYFVLDTSGNVAITGTVTASGFSGSGASLTALNVSTDTTPQLGGDLDTNSNNINFTTGDKAQFGDNAQLKIEYDGSNSIITAGGNGDLQLTSTFDDVQIQGADNVFVLVQGGEDAIKCIGDGSVELYEDGTKVFETTSSGISITGQVTASVGAYGLDSNDYLQFTNNDQLNIYLNNNNEFRFESDGDFHADGDVIAFSTTISSDEKLKENIKVVSDSLDKVEALRGVTFNWKRDGKSSAGVIAQDVMGVLPEAVKEVQGLNDKGSYLSVNYNALTSIFIEAIKDLSARIKILEAK